MEHRAQVSTGVGQLDRLLGGLYIGDNVVWHDNSGSLAHVFCMNFIQTSLAQGRPLIYVSFDRSPRNLIEKLGNLADHESLTILDCFTNGKGGGSGVFKKFYNQREEKRLFSIVQMENPRDMNHFMEVLYGLHATMEGDVRFVFESITGMQELWGGEDQILTFYGHSCPRLYELNTVAYWIMERGAHSQRLRAGITQIAQVVIELSIKRGTTTLNILKAENRDPDAFHKPNHYWTKDLNVVFEDERRATGLVELGWRLKNLRTKRGLSQSELAKLVGVTPSTISQVESSLIYPSLPALVKIAEVLNIEVSSLFQEHESVQSRFVFPTAEAEKVNLPDVAGEDLEAHMLIPVDLDAKAEPYSIEIPPGRTLQSHFFMHKGEEFGYLLSGELQLKLRQTVYKIGPGDVIYLKTDIPTQWKNSGSVPAKIIWLKIK